MTINYSLSDILGFHNWYKEKSFTNAVWKCGWKSVVDRWTYLSGCCLLSLKFVELTFAGLLSCDGVCENWELFSFCRFVFVKASKSWKQNKQIDQQGSRDLHKKYPGRRQVTNHLSHSLVLIILVHKTTFFTYEPLLMVTWG